MPLFSYTALDRKGQEQQNQIEAGDEREAVRILREQKIFVLKIIEGEEALAVGGKLSLGFVRRIVRFFTPRQYLPVRDGDLIIFFHQVALMLRAGHPVVAALEATATMSGKRKLRLAITRMTENIRHGSSFSAAMAKEKKVFVPMISNLIASGEQSGNLDSILDRLADGMERSRDIKRQLIAAIAYPGFVLVFAVGVVAFLIGAVIPRFAKFLTARGTDLPASTQLLMDIADWFQSWGMLVGGVMAIVIFSGLVAYTTRPGKKVIDGVILMLPLVGTSISFASMAQAGWSLAMLLRSGVTALQSLRITSGVMGNLVIADCFERASGQLLEGKNLSKAFEQRHIPLMMRHMAAVGESSGQLDVVMDDVGEYYQKELSALVKVMTVLIEPILILAVGGMVGFVYYAFFQAVMSVSTGGM